MRLMKLLLAIFATTYFTPAIAADIVIRSANNQIELTVTHQANGKLLYSVNYKGKKVILPSGLGFKFQTPAITLQQFDLRKVDSSYMDQTWKPVWGENSSIRDQYRQLQLSLVDLNGSGVIMQIIFRVFNEGVGFRYVFPKQEKLNHFIIADEMTQFALAGDHTAFWIPGDFDTNEFNYNHTRLSAVDASSGKMSQ